MSAIELLAKVRNQTAELTQDKIDRLSIFLVEAPDVVGHLDGRVLCLLAESDWRHVGGNVLEGLQSEKQNSKQSERLSTIFQRYMFRREITDHSD